MASALNSKNPRVKKLNSIMTRIAHFIVEETYTDEPEAQKKLSAAITTLEEVAALLEASDLANPST